MIQEKTDINCSTCTHVTVCAYKSLFENASKYANDSNSIIDSLKDSPIQLSVSCNEYYQTPSTFARICATDPRLEDIIPGHDIILNRSKK